MATEVTLTLLFRQHEWDMDMEEIVKLTERALDCDVTEWDIEEV